MTDTIPSMNPMNKMRAGSRIAGPIPEWARHLPVLPMTPKGHITVTQLDPNDRTKLAYGWDGGDTVAISYEFMEHADHPDIKRLGDILSVGPYQLRLIAVDPWSEWVLAARVDDE